MNSFVISCKAKDLKREIKKKIGGEKMNRTLLLNSNGLVIDRKYFGIMEKFKSAMIKELISPSQTQLSVEEAYKVAKDTEDIYLNSSLNNEAALREAVRKFNNQKGEK
ncbi:MULTISPECIES: hypothetical protein [unclassified Clostridium]|uniref:hypothetical protein n=1 Tax=unclassified Clostridium TaxID=2614128 RepID=UPI001896D8BC|nr:MULTISPECIES: hypothetical protein [unclassified Clostridium]MDU7365386.1 hypothetical protein [Clostridium sp.]